MTSTDGADGLGTANVTWVEDEIYRGTSMLASETPTGRRHYHLDHLGSPRLITDDTGQRLGEHTYLPFGAELDDPLRENPRETKQFTGHERDAIAGDVHTLDYMHARYYGAAVGRFLSFDPRWSKDQSQSQPERWNRYVYAGDSPANFSDPDGRQMKPEPCSPDKCPAPPMETVLRLTPENLTLLSKQQSSQPTSIIRGDDSQPPTKDMVTFVGGVQASFVALGGGSVGASVMHSNRIGLQHAALAATGAVHSPSPRAAVGVQQRSEYLQET